MRLSKMKSLFALLFAFALVAAACSGDDTPAADDGGATTVAAATDDDADDGAMADDEAEDGAMADDEAEDGAMADDGMEDFGGVEVTITGSERDDPSVGAINKALNDWGADHGITVTFAGDADWESNINLQVEAGAAPDISVFPQPGKLADFYRAGTLVELPDEVAATMNDNWSDAWTVFGNVDGDAVGIPVKTDLKSLVWYQPAQFEAKGYDVPETFDDFLALTEQMIAAGDTPLCVGVESGTATGWAYTDWVEEMMLRFEGADVYDQWVNHDIPFNDPAVVTQMQTVLDLWNTEGMVFASGGSIVSTNFGDNVQPLYDGDCMMHRQASFFSSFFNNVVTDDDGPIPLADGSEKAIDVFYFPSNEGAPVLGAGALVAAFNDKPETMAVMEYMSTGEYAEARQIAQRELTDGDLSGFLSAAYGIDPNVYAPLEQSMLDILANASVVRFDASDLMPSDVGAGTFWTEGTSAINGEQDAQEAADKIEASWPAG